MSELERDPAWMEHVLLLLSYFETGDHSNREPLSPSELQVARELVQFIDEMPGGFLIYRAEGHEEIIHANQALLRMFRCESMEEFRSYTGNSFRGMVYPEDLEAVERDIWQQIAENQYDLDYVEYRILRRDGVVRWIEDYGHYVRSKTCGGVFYVFLGDATEKRDRQRQERTLIDQEYLRRLRVIEGLSINYESILYADLDKDKILPYRFSRRTRPLFADKFQPLKYSCYAPVYVDTWVHEDDRELVAEATSPAYIKQQLSKENTYYINYRVLVDGEQQYLQLRVVKVGHREGVSQIVLGYRRMDQELQREMEQTRLLSEALENARLAIVAKNTFLSNMSHDMRTPLNAIFGFTALARRNLENPELAADYLQRVEASGRLLLEHIDHVLELSWSGSNEAAGSKSEELCDLRTLAQEVYDFLLPQAEEKGLSFSLCCDGLRHPEVYADAEKLSQLMMYLANNAVTYTHQGSVSMTWREGEEPGGGRRQAYQLVVSDTGVGISEEFRTSIFEPFIRERNTTLSGVHGIGLGLTIAKNIADRMGGTIDVESAVGQGSTFTVTLRLRALQSPLPAAPEVPKEPRSILIVEDNKLNLEIAMELLEELGFQVDSAENGQLGLEKVAASAPGDYDLILMDIQMPVMDGWQAAQAIRRLPDPALARIPIVALSANGFESDIKTSMECGMDAHLTKPLDLPLPANLLVGY